MNWDYINRTMSKVRSTEEMIKQNKIIEKTIKIQQDDKEIYGLALIPNSGKEKYPMVIISHGFGGNYRDNLNYAEVFAAKGIASYCFDFRGGCVASRSSRKTKEMSVLTELEDLRTVISYIKAQDFVDINNIFLLGESQGGLVSALIAPDISGEISGLMLLYPAFVIPDDARKQFASKEDIEEIVHWDMPLGKKYYEDVWDMDFEKEITGFNGPVIIFHGTDDDIVPLDYSRRAKECYENCELIVYSGLGHGFHGRQADPSAKAMLDFIEKNIKKENNYEKV